MGLGAASLGARKVPAKSMSTGKKVVGGSIGNPMAGLMDFNQMTKGLEELREIEEDYKK